jgi:hypothetical protein
MQGPGLLLPGREWMSDLCRKAQPCFIYANSISCYENNSEQGWIEIVLFVTLKIAECHNPGFRKTGWAGLNPAVMIIPIGCDICH